MKDRDSKKLSDGGVFRISDIRKFGVSKLKLAKLVRDEKILRLAPGFYVHQDSKLDPDEYDFALACKKFGSKSLIGGLSALYHYRLIPNVPDELHPPKLLTQL